MDSGVDGWRETSDVVASNGWEPPLLSRDGRWLVYRDIAPLDGASASTIDEDASPYVEAVHAVRVYDKRTHQDRMLVGIPRSDGWRDDGERGGFRSEEHTSELQSLMRISYAVFCLKTKQNSTSKTQTNIRI